MTGDPMKTLIPVRPSHEALLYIWPDRTLSFSGNRVLAPHRHGAAELVFAFDEPFDCQLADGRRVQSRSLLIPPNVAHQNSHRDALCAIVYLDAEGRDYRSQTASLDCQYGVYADLPSQAEVQGILKRIYRERPDAASCRTQLDQALGCEWGGEVTPFDSRIVEVMTLIREDLTQNRPIEEIAAAVSLSSDRLLHLFVANVGVPYRTYRAWMRLKRAARLCFDGQDLTSAAHATGFTDSAHFSKTFRNMFGMAPSEVLSQRQNLTVNFG